MTYMAKSYGKTEKPRKYKEIDENFLERMVRSGFKLKQICATFGVDYDYLKVHFSDKIEFWRSDQQLFIRETWLDSAIETKNCVALERLDQKITEGSENEKNLHTSKEEIDALSAKLLEIARKPDPNDFNLD